MKQNRHFTGLSEAQVLESRKLYGSNRIDPPKKESVWKLFIEKFKDPLIVVLLVALALSVFASVYQFVNDEETSAVFLEPAGIFLAIMLAVGISFLFELNAKKKFDILNKEGESQPTKVIRDGNYRMIGKQDVVVGDIVVLDTGDEIPADGILIDSVSMMVNESVLTGEPMTRKTINSQEFNSDATYPSDRVMRGTVVMEGHGTMKVTMVGMRTEYGKVYEGAQIENTIKTPLNIQLEKLSNLITTLSYLVAGLIIVGRAILFFNQGTPDDGSLIDIGRYVLNTIMLAITIIVVAVPEGLPMSVSLSLALSMRRMLSTNNLVRKMHACETMGSATVICTDKTGTLTQNQMRVSETNFFSLGENQSNRKGIAWDIIVKSIAANSTANLNFSDENKIKTVGNPTEAALLLWLHENGVDYREVRESTEVIAQSAFSTVKKFMATVIPSDNEEEEILLVKGAPEIVLTFCTDVLGAQLDEHPLTDEKRQRVLQLLADYQNRAMRTLGFAYRRIARGAKCFDGEGMLRMNDLVYLGVVAIQDPIREEVPEAVKGCIDAGIKIKMVTGDTPGTAIEIGRQIGLWNDDDKMEVNHITGAEFAATSNDAILARLKDIKIMSRARPMDKSRLVSLLQQQGEVVAVTGDGTNDAPALNAAQVGLSMGDGTSVAKNASAITILDNSFRSINRAVLWGRSLYRNIQRFIYFQLIINIAACLIVLIGSFVDVRSPLTVTQMLWVNLIMDTFAAIALASLPPDERVMKDPPRDVNANIITREMLVRILSISICFVITMIGVLLLMRYNTITSATDFFSGNLNWTAEKGDGLSPYELSLFFTMFVMMQFWNLFNCKAFKSEASAFWKLHKCTGFLIIAAVILVAQILIINYGGQMFNVVPIFFTDWVVILASTAIILALGEIVRLFMYIARKTRK